MKQRITVTLDDKLCTVLRVEAAKENKRPNYIIEMALMQYLRKKPKTKATAPSIKLEHVHPEPIEPPALTMTPEEEEEWAKALTIGE